MKWRVILSTRAACGGEGRTEIVVDAVNSLEAASKAYSTGKRDITCRRRVIHVERLADES